MVCKVLLKAVSPSDPSHGHRRVTPYDYYQSLRKSKTPARGHTAINMVVKVATSLLTLEPTLLPYTVPQLPTPRTASPRHGSRGHCHPPFSFRVLSAGPLSPTRNKATGVFCASAELTEGSSSASPDPVCSCEGVTTPTAPRDPAPPETCPTFLLGLSRLGPFPCWHLLLHAQRFWWGDRASQVPWKGRVGVRSSLGRRKP